MDLKWSVLWSRFDLIPLPSHLTLDFIIRFHHSGPISTLTLDFLKTKYRMELLLEALRAKLLLSLERCYCIKKKSEELLIRSRSLFDTKSVIFSIFLQVCFQIIGLLDNGTHLLLRTKLILLLIVIWYLYCDKNSLIVLLVWQNWTDISSQ